MQRFETLRDSYPKFFAWVSSNQEVITDFVPERWKSPDWEDRVTRQAVAEIFGRPMPEDYFRFLRAFCHAEVWKYRLGIELNGGLHVDPIQAIRLAAGEEPGAISLVRYDDQPGEFYPFADMGVDGVSYNFYFDGDDFVLVYFSPMDREQVPFFYPDMMSFLTDEILGSLGRMEPDEVLRRGLEGLGMTAEFLEGACLDCAVFITAFDIQIPKLGRERFQEDCKNRVRSIMQNEKLPLLKRWL